MKGKKFQVKYAPQDTGAIDREVLDTFNYEYPGRRIEVVISSEEFTSLCPWSGLPDFAKLTIRYVPNKRCIELKSLKYYLLSYRNVGIVYEHAVNKILEDLVRACDPLEMHVEMEFNVRGGIKTTVKASHMKHRGRAESKEQD
jgi:7-cyano-7-deazaguanine reductase